MTELVVGTKKGLFLLEGEPGSAFEITTRAFAGQPVDFATRDPRTGRLFATVTSPFYGPKVFYTDGDPDEDWAQADGIALPEGGDQALERRYFDAGHCRKRRNRFFVFVHLGKAEQRAFVQISVAMQRHDRTLRRREIPVAFDLLRHAGNFGHRLLDLVLPGQIDQIEQAAADRIDRSGQQIL